MPVLGERRRAHRRAALPRLARRRARRECEDITALWRDDFVGFVLGCSLSFEHALQAAGPAVRHVDEQVVPMYRTRLQTVPVGPFRGPMVVSMRPYAGAGRPRRAHLRRAAGAHGAPVQVGDAAALASPTWACRTKASPPRSCRAKCRCSGAAA